MLLDVVLVAVVWVEVLVEVGRAEVDVVVGSGIELDVVDVGFAAGTEEDVVLAAGTGSGMTALLLASLLPALDVVLD